MLCPGWTSSATSTEPAPVWIPQPSGPSLSRGSDLSTTTVLRAVARQWVANDDCPNHREVISAPLASVTPVVKSTRRPSMLRTRNVSQWAGTPARHISQLQQRSEERTTGPPKIGRAAGRERVWPYVVIAVDPES